MAELDSNLVYRGFWINRSKGTVLGSTITTDNTSGNVLVAFLAVLVSIATSYLWNLIVFAFHQLRSGKGRGDGLFRQQQVLLRTQPSPGITFVESLRLSWTWRTNASRSLTRSLAWTLFALTYALATLTASIFSSYVVSSADIEVLVQNTNCSALNSTMSAEEDSLAYLSHLWSLGHQYYQTCYTTEQVPSQCQLYVRPRIDFNVSTGECPFANDICLASDPPSIVVDSGLIDSNDVFGINAPIKDRVMFRRKATYTPLVMDGHTSIASPSEVDEWTGPSPGYDFPEQVYFMVNYNRPSGFAHTTIFYASTVSNATSDYSLMTFGPAGPTDFIPELTIDDVDVSLVTIYSNLVYNERPTDDPIFSAHQAFSNTCNSEGCHGKGKGNYTYYAPDFWAGTIGCTEQYQFCLPSESSPGFEPDHCTALAGTVNYTQFFDQLPEANEAQSAVMKLMLPMTAVIDIASISGSNHVEMNASSTVFSSVQQRALPTDQWTYEVRAIEAHVYATCQKFIADNGIGLQHQGVPIIDTIPLPTPPEQAVCRSFKMRKAGGFSNISVFGLAFIVGVAVFVTLLETILLKVLIFTRRFHKSLSPSIDRWTQDGIFHLQRRAYEAQGYRTWRGLEADIPVATGREQFDDLPLHGYSDSMISQVDLSKQSTAVTTLTDAPKGSDAAEFDAVSRIS